MGLAPFFLGRGTGHGASWLFGFSDSAENGAATFPFADVRLRPNYPAKSPLEEILRRVEPGTDEFITEKYAFEIEALLHKFSNTLKSERIDLSALAPFLHTSIEASSLTPVKVTALRTGEPIETARRQFGKIAPGRDRFLEEFHAYLGKSSRIETAEFQIVSIEETGHSPLQVTADIRYNFVINHSDGARDERVGQWSTEWTRDRTDDGSNAWQARRWVGGEETIAVVRGPVFIDVTSQALGGAESYRSQMLHGADYWRTVLDGASGIDVYGNNGVAAGDYDNDGLDDIYVCQPAGLPNRLYRNRGDGTFEDVTEKSSVGVLDGSACALFADFDNRGLQDLLVVCGTGPLLFVNQGNGTFSLKRNAFRFEGTPQGAFTHAALADYDGDGRLDIYLCTYSYYVGLDQYHYPVPYYDARNGPANILLHNEGNATFVEKTQAAGLNVDNDRYSFACAWGDFNLNGRPDLYVANDFGRGNLYRNNGDGTFTAISDGSHVEDPGAGMSACWSDIDNDGAPDIYVGNMWSSAGQRVSQQKIFHEKASADIRAHYKRHARGNALYKNERNGQFENISQKAGVEMGRWSWCSDFWDFDHDGYPDLYVANGYISAPDKNDLGSFFWRQVVAKSPEDATPSLAYEHGWNALNELIRSDVSWNGHERNVFFANNHDGTFAEVSGALGLDFLEDSRSFALADLDHDGRLEVILKNRNAPQLRILHNAMNGLGDSISFRLRGHKSNRDAIGAAVTIEIGALRQTRYLQAGSGFLAQHSKELFFGVGKPQGNIRATVHWPSGLSQTFEDLPTNHRIELEEGRSTFAAKPFAAAPNIYTQARPTAIAEHLPSQVETWLLQPLKAPQFSLPDVAGSTHELQSLRGRFVLLNFWATTVPASLDQLRLLHKHRSALAAGHLEIAGVNVDTAADAGKARSFAAQQAFGFPVLFATEEAAGLYNIVYRYIFDRRRDLGIPTSFLLDREGMIVKVYQGAIDPQRLLDDLSAVPVTAEDRMRKAIPLAGILCQDAFQRNDFTYGVAMFQHGYLDQAAESFQEVIAAKPNDPEGYYNLGTLNLRRNDLKQARSYLEQTLKLRPSYPEAWNNLGMIEAQEGHPEEAIQNFQKSIQLRPGYAIALLNLGNVYRRQGSAAKAQESLHHALELQPDDPEISYSLGMLYAQGNQMAQAADFLQKAIELRPDYPEALNNLGVLFVREQDYAKAEQQFKTCVAIEPTFDQSYLNLARLYAMQRDKGKALAILQELLRLQPQNQKALSAMQMLQQAP